MTTSSFSESEFEIWVFLKFVQLVLKMLGLKDSDSNMIMILSYKEASGMEWTKYNVL